MIETSTHVIEYIAKHANVIKTIDSIDKANQTLAKNMANQFGQVTKILGQTYSNLGTKQIIKDGQVFQQSLTELTTTAETSSGKVLQFKERFTSLGGELRSNSTTFKEVNQTTETLGQSIERLTKRALVTIPVWFALRQGAQSIIGTFKDAVKGLLDFDLALQKVRRNMTGTPAEIEKNMQIIREEVTKTSLATGKSTEEITDAIKKFATIGFSAEDALAGGIEATKLSVVLFGDASETAESFARSLKLLMDTSKDAKSAQEQFAETMAYVSEIEKTNQFELNEVNESLMRFAPTAKAAGFSAKQTVALLAALGTAGLSGARGGTLLSSSVNKLRSNLTSLSKELGINVNPQMDSTFEVLMKVLDAVSQLQGTDKLGAGAITAISEIFGGERGTKTISALIGVNKTLKDNLKVTADMTKYQSDLNTVLNSASGSAAIAQNAFKEFKKELLLGITGADNFDDAMRKVAETMQTLQKTGRTVGEGFKNAFIEGIFGGGGTGFLLRNISAFTNNLIKQVTDSKKRLEDGLSGKLSTLELKNLIVELVGINFDPKIIQQLRNQFAKQFEAEKVESKIEITPVVSPIESRISPEDIQTIEEAVIKSRLESLKVLGLTSSELLKQEEYLYKQFGIQEELDKKLERQLERERAINEEKRLQSKLSSDTMKLYEIAKTKGTDVARQIGDVLAGSMDFSTFVRRGGAALDVFKKEFADLYEQQQALAFFGGRTVPGQTGLTGGSRIQIQENLGYNAQSFDVQAELLRQRLISQEVSKTPLTLPSQQIQQTNQITQNVNIISNDTQKVKNEVLKLFSTPEFKNALSQAVTGERNTKL